MQRERSEDRSQSAAEPEVVEQPAQADNSKFTGQGALPAVASQDDQPKASASDRAFGDYSDGPAQQEQAPNAMYQARLNMPGRREDVVAKSHDIPNQDIIIEQLAHRGAYDELDRGNLAAWGYRDAGAVTDPESGFRAVLYMPTDEAVAGDTDQGKIIQTVHGGAPPPVLAFRGTQEKRGMQDDVNRHGVGSYQWASNEQRVAAVLASAGGAKVIAAGHSLGGALAQHAACHLPGMIKRVVTFQSPAIAKSETAKLAQHNQSAAPEDQIKSSHYRSSGDIVHAAGEALTKGEVYTFESVGIASAKDHTSFPLARLSAARGDLIPGVNEGLGAKGGDRLTDVEKTSSEDEKSGVLPAINNGAVNLLGGLIRDESMERYVDVWNGVKEMIGSGAFGKNYVLGVIDIAELTDVQKDKMRLQASEMLGS